MTSAERNERWRRKQGQKKRVPPPCGTPAAARRHRRRGEPLDDACREAERVYNREADRRRRARKILTTNQLTNKETPK